MKTKKLMWGWVVLLLNERIDVRLGWCWNGNEGIDVGLWWG